MLETSDYKPLQSVEQKLDEYMSDPVNADCDALTIFARSFVDAYPTVGFSTFVNACPDDLFDRILERCGHSKAKAGIVVAIHLRRAVFESDHIWIELPDASANLWLMTYIRKTLNERLRNLNAFDSGVPTVMRDALDKFDSEFTFLKTALRNGNPNAADFFSICEQASAALIRGVENLSLDSTVLGGVAQLVDLIKREEAGLPLNLIDRAIGLEFGREATRLVDDGMKRFWRLSMLMFTKRPSDRTFAFLRRVSRCYLFGFDSECCIMCRAALDVEFSSEISTDDCIRVQGTRKPLSYSLTDRIATARRLSRISDEAAKNAWAVVKDGNSLVHSTPEIKTASLAMIDLTVGVIAELGLTRQK